MLMLQKLKDESLPISHRIEFSHSMTRCCCQPHLAINTPDTVHTAVPSFSSTPSARRTRGGEEQVLGTLPGAW